MSAYEITLKFDRDTFGGGHAMIVARDPLWEAGHVEAISHQCVGITELEYEVNRLKLALDKVLADGKRKFASAKRDIIAKSAELKG